MNQLKLDFTEENTAAISIIRRMRGIRKLHTPTEVANCPDLGTNLKSFGTSVTDASLKDSGDGISYGRLSSGEAESLSCGQPATTVSSKLPIASPNPKQRRSRRVVRFLDWASKTTFVMSLGWLLLAATMLGVIGILKAWEGIGSGVRVVETRLWETRINDLQAQLNLAESRARFLHRINVVEHPTGTGKLMVEIKENRQPEWFKVRGKDGRWTYRCFSELALQQGK
jgi:hypothetical protein